MSITQSLAATTRMSCSTTITVLPASTRPLQLRHQLVDVGRMQAGGRLVEHVERVAALRALQLGGELDALRLAARQLGRRLAEAQVAEADVAAAARSGRSTAGSSAKKAQASSTVMPQHLGDVLVAPGDLERLLVVARAVAGRAGRVDAGHEEQLDADEALALAGLAAALGDVEREAAGVVAARARRRRRGEQLAHVVEEAGVGGEVGARRAADRLLVDAHQPPDRAPCRRAMWPRVSLGDASARRASPRRRPPRRLVAEMRGRPARPAPG